MARDLYAEITSTIIAALENGIVPWRRPWAQHQAHANLHSGHEYRGVNQLILNATSAARGFTQPHWLTFRQVKDLGGSVRSGERASLVVFWSALDRDTGQKNSEGEPIITRTFLLRHYNVFNVEQTTGIEHHIPATTERAFEPIQECDRIWNAFPDKPTLQHGGDRASYTPSRDHIQMPPRASFHKPEGYYGTLFHEAIHSTGHKSRLNRDTLTQMAPFGSPVYSEEELVAEIGSAMLVARAGIQPDVNNSAAYIAGWLRALRGDKRLIIIASQRAEKAARHVLGETPAPAATSTATEALGVERGAAEA